MIYLPAAAGRTTRNLRRAGLVAAGIAATFAVTTAVAEVFSALHHTPGAHFSLYAGLIVSSVIAASCLSFAFARTMISYSATASAADHDAQTSAMRRQADEFGQLAAEVADVVTTAEQLVAESARQRMALRDAEADRKADIEHLVGVVLPDLLKQVRREGFRAGADEGEMRGFARGLAAAREMADGDTGPIRN